MNGVTVLSYLMQELALSILLAVTILVICGRNLFAKDMNLPYRNSHWEHLRALHLTFRGRLSIQWFEKNHVFFFLNLLSFQEENDWLTLFPFNERPPPLVEYGMVGIENNFLYLFGGSRVLDQNYDLLWKYDMEQNAWELLNSSSTHPSPRRAFTMSAYEEGFVVFGGILDGSAVTNELWHFNTSDDTWNLLVGNGEQPDPRRYHVGEVIGDGIYIFGGISDTQNILQDFFYFDIGEIFFIFILPIYLVLFSDQYLE